MDSDENLLIIVNDSILNLALKYILHESEVIPKLATTAPFVKGRMTRANLKVVQVVKCSLKLRWNVTLKGLHR